MFRRQLWILFFLVLPMVVSAQKTPQLIPYEDNGLWGYSDSRGRIAIAPKWVKADFFKNGRANVHCLNIDRYDISCIIDTKGRYIIPPERNWNGDWRGLENTPLNVHDDHDNWGLIDTNNHLYIPIKYKPLNLSNTFTSNNPWHKPVLIAMEHDKTGIIDTFGHVLIPFEYHYIRFDPGTKELQGFIVAQKDSRTGIIDTYNQVVLPFTHEIIWCAHSFFVASRNGKYGILDRNMKELVPFEYDLIKLKGNEFRLFKTTQQEPGDKFVAYMETLDANTLSVLTALKVVDDDEYWDDIGIHRPNLDWCGFGRHMAAQIEAAQESYERGRPKLAIHGKALTDFTIDSIQWATQNYELDFTNQLPLLTTTGTGEFSAIIDQHMNFLVKPMPGPLKAITYNATDSLIAVYQEDSKGSCLYGLLDSHWKEVIPLQPQRIISGFRWKGKVFAEMMDGNYAINHLRDFNPREDRPLLHRPYTYRLMNSDSQLVQPGGYRFIKMVGNDGNTNANYDDHFMLVSDTAGFMGIVNLDGEVLFPEVSFKYKDILGRGCGIFFVKSCATDSNAYEKCDYFYVSEHGKRLFSKLSIHNITATEYPGLFAVEHDHGFFYYNKNGTAYTSAKLE